ncbi:coiled-coil-helix-coiled-coil-helix domain-containing protein 5 isoform X3 [Podarcis raffonei]|uniref:coiled-coil-helix-coiled-coil-helix domain-containing protein 5 isoform X3 n=1 Tax=Podarcis raffonei TaxID=65483 RepID=UPI0023291A49|nr:coiled-coil-helix-coiled-coil-helix domain-containing protein 5 isoform X3 [Podarcis raffonei]
MPRDYGQRAGCTIKTLNKPKVWLKKNIFAWHLKVCNGGARQAALEVTARHCRKEAEQYGQCVAANPSSWQQDCHQLKLEMAKCTSSHTKKGDLLCVNSGVSTGLKVPGSRNGNNVILKIY